MASLAVYRLCVRNNIDNVVILGPFSARSKIISHEKSFTQLSVVATELWVLVILVVGTIHDLATKGEDVTGKRYTMPALVRRGASICFGINSHVRGGALRSFCPESVTEPTLKKSAPGCLNNTSNRSFGDAVALGAVRA